MFLFSRDTFQWSYIKLHLKTIKLKTWFGKTWGSGITVLHPLPKVSKIKFLTF